MLWERIERLIYTTILGCVRLKVIAHYNIILYTTDGVWQVNVLVDITRLQERTIFLAYTVGALLTFAQTDQYVYETE